jgi:hypothetical protein
MDRVLKFNLNLDRYEKSEPLDIKIEEEETKTEETTTDEKVDEPEPNINNAKREGKTEETGKEENEEL